MWGRAVLDKSMLLHYRFNGSDGAGKPVIAYSAGGYGHPSSAYFRSVVNGMALS
jgi:hypothetical protein